MRNSKVPHFNSTLVKEQASHMFRKLCLEFLELYLWYHFLASFEVFEPSHQ